MGISAKRNRKPFRADNIQLKPWNLGTDDFDILLFFDIKLSGNTFDAEYLSLLSLPIRFIYYKQLLSEKFI